MPEKCPVRYCTGGAESVLWCLSRRTCSSGACAICGLADARWLSRLCPQRHHGSDSVIVVVTRTRLTRMSWLTGHAKPLRPALFFWWPDATKPQSCPWGSELTAVRKHG